MDKPIKIARKENEEVRIFQDGTSESPREWDNLGKMVCFHRRYELGDKTDLKSDDFNGWDELEKYLYEEENAVMILPLYLYDHSGLRMKVGSFQGLLPEGHARFDSGQVGFIYVSGKDIREQYGVKRITPQLRKKVEAILIGEVETYDQYLCNDIYGFELVKITKCDKCESGDEEVTDSCWGFYGSDIKTNGMLEHLDDKWKDAEFKDVE